MPGARAWRRELSRHATDLAAGTGVVTTALALVADAIDQQQPSAGYRQLHG